MEALSPSAGRGRGPPNLSPPPAVAGVDGRRADPCRVPSRLGKGKEKGWEGDRPQACSAPLLCDLQEQR